MLARPRRNVADCGVLPGSQQSHQTRAMSRSIAIVEDEPAIREDLMNGLHTFYPEYVGAQATEERFLVRRDCPD